MNELNLKAKENEENKIITEERFEELLKEYKRPLLICAGRTVNKYITEQDEEWSVALLAFHEAVKSYSEGKGNFNAFMNTVVKRRLTDYLRGEYKRASTDLVPPDTFTGNQNSEEPESVSSQIQSKMSEAALVTGEWPGKYTIADEINAMQTELHEYGFSFYDLTECSPKADKTKKKCADAVTALIKSKDLFRHMEEAKTLPVTALSKESKVSKKVLEKHRKYLIAAALIISGDYPMLAEYLEPIRKAMR